MTLYIVGIGLHDEKDITVKGLEFVHQSDYVYLDSYTSVLSCPVGTLERFYGKSIILADREFVEKRAAETILAQARSHDVTFLVVGDALSATTHTQLYIEGLRLGIPVVVVHNASVFSAVGITGLQLYKFGRTTSMPFWTEHYRPHTAYDVIAENKKSGLHTLILLDLAPTEQKYMSVNQAIQMLLDIEIELNEGIFTENTLCVGCARLGSAMPMVRSGTAEHLRALDFGSPLHCLVVPGTLHFMEEEALQMWNPQHD